ncbi:MAG: FGGY family carbohydrate kinase [Bacillota bacterium]
MQVPNPIPATRVAEQNPDDWWGAASRCVKECIGRLADQHTEIDAIGFSGHMSGLVIVDKEGLPLRPCILLSDGRSAKESEDLGSDSAITYCVPPEILL